MGKDSTANKGKAKDTGKGKDTGGKSKGGGEEKGGKGKGKPGKEELGTCTYVKARHILCEKQGKINEAYKKLQEGWLDSGDKVPPAEFAKLAAEYSECPSGKKGGDLGWFPRGKMAGPFQEVAFNTPRAYSALLSSPRTGIISSWLRDGKIDVKHEESVALDFYMKIEAFSIMNYVEP